MTISGKDEENNTGDVIKEWRHAGSDYLRRILQACTVLVTWMASSQLQEDTGEKASSRSPLPTKSPTGEEH